MSTLRKYPRTPHILDSALQVGDEVLARAEFDAIAGRHIVVEEKLDGANAAISFDADGNLLLQSRGHYLTGGPRERHFALMKGWAHGLRDALWDVLRARHIVYGEWLYAKHTLYYDALPDYFLEFDVLDLETGRFLSTPRRRVLLAGLPLRAVPVLHEGPIASAAALERLIGPPAYQSPGWRASLKAAAAVAPHDAATVERQTDQSGLMEGLYLKVEDTDEVLARFKYIRHGFLQAVADSDSHWQSRPILPNRLAAKARAP